MVYPEQTLHASNTTVAFELLSKQDYRRLAFAESLKS